MARYHKHLQYHEDVVEKHPLTLEEIQFLMELQKEMNAQDLVSQADPRFWVIQGTEREYGIESGYEDGADLVDDNGCCVVATDMESAAEYIRDKYAMTSWRNRETEMLWKILRQADWELLLSHLKPGRQDEAEYADQPVLAPGA